MTSGQTHTFEKKRCIDKADQKTIFEIYIVHVQKTNSSGIFYDCDSIEHKNQILRHVTVTDPEKLKFVYGKEKRDKQSGG